jgi:hypothetical protein
MRKAILLLATIALVAVFAAAHASAQDGENWGALAGAVWRDGQGNAHAAVGASLNHATPDEAISAAIASCRESGGVGCEVVGGGAFTGCAFIAVGGSGGQVGYNGGPTAQIALDRCTSHGWSCHEPIGGCNDADDEDDDDDW